MLLVIHSVMSRRDNLCQRFYCQYEGFFAAAHPGNPSAILKRYGNHIIEEGISFEYDPVKSAINHQKHGIDFYEARAIWESEVLELDTYPGNDSQRSIVIGMIDERLWTVVITRREERIRIISVRRARKYEERLYSERNSGC